VGISLEDPFCDTSLDAISLFELVDQITFVGGRRVRPPACLPAQAATCPGCQGLAAPGHAVCTLLSGSRSFWYMQCHSPALCAPQLLADESADAGPRTAGAAAAAGAGEAAVAIATMSYTHGGQGPAGEQGMPLVAQVASPPMPPLS
jgi:hypothetical protein